MAANVWYYPTQAAATSTLTFNDSANGWARSQDDVDEIQFNAEIGVTKGGSDMVKEYGTAKNIYSFTFIVPKTKTASETDLADFLTFIGVVRCLYTFQWYDVDVSPAVYRTVRLTSTTIKKTRLGGKWFQITVQLRDQT
jgi:hypothetical protein